MGEGEGRLLHVSVFSPFACLCLPALAFQAKKRRRELFAKEFFCPIAFACWALFLHWLCRWTLATLRRTTILVCQQHIPSPPPPPPPPPPGSQYPTYACLHPHLPLAGSLGLVDSHSRSSCRKTGELLLPHLCLFCVPWHGMHANMCCMLALCHVSIWVLVCGEWLGWA